MAGRRRGRRRLRLIEAYSVDYVLVAPRRQWRLDGSREYSAVTAAVLVPVLDDLRKELRATVVYESDPKELVRVYRLERK